jgi:hypothetical protein
MRGNRVESSVHLNLVSTRLAMIGQGHCRRCTAWGVFKLDVTGEVIRGNCENLARLVG